ncbi:MAG: DegQ family serine endoprotease [Reyranella sp.]|nr:DegQ family serine endoprotease [Reyranella sp.]MBL6651031.1 DegQ family serine endoprotease [Reyranella sp.]
MTKTKSRILTALALTTALTAPVLIAPMFTAPAAVAAAPTAVSGVQDFSDLAAKVTPAVVNVAVTMKAGAADDDEMRMADKDRGSDQQKQMEEFMQRFAERFGMPMQPGQPGQPGMKPQRPAQKGQAVGTGFIIDEKGWIVTNYHVAGKADEITVTLADGRKLPAKLMGGDEKTDLALLKVESDKPLPYVTFGDATKVRVGQPVMAVGNPFGLGGTVTTGIVSARGRDIHSGPFDDYIQTDAAINRGNSGGPLFDMEGRVIGINTAIFSPSGGSVGLGFAIPSSLAQPVVDQLKANGKVERGLLGVQIQPVSEELAKSMSLDSEKGALVAQVTPDSAAMAAGIQSGDLIKSVDGKSVESVKDLTRMISGMKPGTSAKIGLWRDGKDMTVTAKIGGDQVEAKAIKASADKTDGKQADAKAQPMSYGVSLAPISKEARQGLKLDDSVKGALIAAVEPGSPADDIGLKQGDVLQQVGRDQIDSPQAAVEKLKEAKKTGKPVLMKVYREGMTRFVAISPRAA